MNQLKHVLQSRTNQLALTYLAIIMTMTICFSVVTYQTSSRQLGRQAPARGSYAFELPDNDDRSPVFSNERTRLSINNFLEQRAQEAKRELILRLLALNLLVLAAGAGFSYYLARRTLRPIEAAMEAQGQFVSDASHELRTPLTALQTSNEVALRKKKLTLDEAKQLIQQNIEETTKLKELSDALLGLLQSDASKLDTTSVRLQDSVMQAINQVIQPAIDKNITIDDNVADINIEANEQALTQVFTILLDNAIKYSPESTAISLQSAIHGKHAVITLADQGNGIKASDLPHIFRRFYRADKARSSQNEHGYGLGLAIAQQIIKKLGGTITVESQIEKGTTFTITLPVSKRTVEKSKKI